jgi:ubiquinone/menaquinone biosynthesis C-methylase UbiE/glycosyltransferase involved in cell wall biosynthesis
MVLYEKIKILDIMYYMTCPPTSGGALRIISPYANMKENENIEVDFLFSSWEHEYVGICKKYLLHIPVIKNVVGIVARHYLNHDIDMPHGFSRDVWVTMSSELRDKAIEMVTNKFYDIIQIEHSQLAWIVPALRLASPHSKIVLDLHNVEHLIYKRWLNYATPNQKNEIEKKYTSLYNWESKVWKWFDAAFTVSPIESKMFKELSGCEKVFEVPTGGGIDPDVYMPKDEQRRRPYDLLYLGTMEWFPNAHGLLWFINNVFPYILQREPNLKLHIVGFGNPDSELYKIAQEHPNIKFWGQQPDDKKFFHGAKVFIVPLWIGAGARVKIPTAWASKVPIVSTYLGAEGLNARNMENIILADDPKEFAEGVLTLLSDQNLWKRIVDNALGTVKNEYSLQKCVELLKKGYRDIIDASDDQIILKDYHIQFIEHLTQHMQLEGKRILEIGCGDGSLLKTIAKYFRPSYIVGIDSTLEGNRGLDLYRDTPAVKKDNWEIKDGDALALPFDDNSFDIVISVASFEHITDISKCLSEIKRVLKPGGSFYTDFAPIWSSIVGHHWYNWIEEKNQLIPPWGHLWMSETEMLHYLAPTQGKQQAELICFGIYHDPWINRMDVRQLEGAFRSSGMSVIILNKNTLVNRLGWLTGAQENELTEEITGRLSERYSPQELLVSGFEVLLQKDYVAH